MNYVWQFILIIGLWFAGSVQAAGDHFGVWRGNVTEVVVPGQKYSQYNITLTVTPDGYRIDYGELSCGGALRLLSHQGRFYRFRDELNYGLKNCINGGLTEIHFIDAERAVFQWFDKKGELKVEGHLRRGRQVMT